MLKPFARLLRHGIVATALLASLAHCAELKAAPNADEAILLRVAEVLHPPAGQDVSDMAYRLFAAMHDLTEEQAASLQDSTIDSIASLLPSEDDMVEIYVAHALGVLGRRARRALPALRAARDRYVEPPPSEGLLAYEPIAVVFEIEQSIREVEGASSKDEARIPRVVVLGAPANELVFDGPDSDMPGHGAYLFAMPGTASSYMGYEHLVETTAAGLPHWMAIAVRRSSGDQECLVMVNDIDYLSIAVRSSMEKAGLDAVPSARYMELNGAPDYEGALARLQQDVCERVRGSR
jgi:hypothetical protein